MGPIFENLWMKTIVWSCETGTRINFLPREKDSACEHLIQIYLLWVGTEPDFGLGSLTLGFGALSTSETSLLIQCFYIAPSAFYYWEGGSWGLKSGSCTGRTHNEPLWYTLSFLSILTESSCVFAAKIAVIPKGYCSISGHSFPLKIMSQVQGRLYKYFLCTFQHVLTLAPAWFQIPVHES